MRDLPRLKRWNIKNPTRHYALAATVLVAAGLALWAGYRVGFADSYSTRIGEQRLVRLDDPHLAELPISGIYHAGDSRAFAETMARLYGLELVEDGGVIHLRDPARS